MSNSWTNQQKLLHDIKVAGGAEVGLKVLKNICKWGDDRVETLFEKVNEDGMGINRATSILEKANYLGPECVEILLAGKIAEQQKNVTLIFKKRA